MLVCLSCTLFLLLLIDPVLLAIMIGPRGGHMTLSGPVTILSWDFKIYRGESKTSLVFIELAEVSLELPVVTSPASWS